MENVEIARALSEIADLLEIRQENPFKVRAYRTAVRTIGDLTRPLAAMVAAGEDLTALRGIGKDMAGYIRELIETGHTVRLDRLEREVPGGVAEFMHLDGIGPNRARILHDELGITSIADLKRALDNGEVDSLPGFGAKTVSKVRRSIDQQTGRPSRYRLADADDFVRSILAWMHEAEGVERIEAAGSWRRRAETVGDIDLIAICARAAPVMQHFVAYPDIARVEATGETRGTIVLKSGLHVDLRILPRESYGAALHYFTGSKAHNIAVRRLGVERDLRISEYGVFRVPRTKQHRPREKRVGGATEEDVFASVGMSFVPPELREDRGEVEAARENRLPRLITLDDMRGDLQMHSTWTDGRDTIEAMARGCLERGYQYMAITDHSSAVTVARGLTPKRLLQQWKEIERVRRALPDLLILHGMEVDILRDGTLDLANECLRKLDIVVISVHSHMNLPAPAMTERVIRALQHPCADILAHPTGRIINERPPFEIDLDAVLRAAAERDVAVELNAQPHRLDLNDVQAQRAKELGVRLAISTDAHSVDSLDFMHFGIDQARRGWIEKRDVINAMPASALLAWLERRRARADGGWAHGSARRGRAARPDTHSPKRSGTKKHATRGRQRP